MKYISLSARKMARERLVDHPKRGVLEIYFVRKVLWAPRRNGKTIIERAITPFMGGKFRSANDFILLHPCMPDGIRGEMIAMRAERKKLARNYLLRALATSATLPLVVVLHKIQMLAGAAVAGCVVVLLFWRQHQAYRRLRYCNSYIEYGLGGSIEEIVSIERENSRIEAALAEFVRTGHPFILMLRSYDLEVTKVVTPAATASKQLKERVPHFRDVISTRFIRTDVTAEDRLTASLLGVAPAIRMRNLEDLPPDVRPNAGGIAPRLYLPSNIWKSAVRELIELAPMLTIHIVTLTPGVKYELETIIGLNKQDVTVVVICDPPDIPEFMKGYADIMEISIYDYAPVDLADPLLRAFPRVVRARDIDYGDLASVKEFRDWGE